MTSSWRHSSRGHIWLLAASIFGETFCLVFLGNFRQQIKPGRLIVTLCISVWDKLTEYKLHEGKDFICLACCLLIRNSSYTWSLFSKYIWNEHHESACKLNKKNPVSHPSSSIPLLYIQRPTFRVHVEKTLKGAPELHFTVTCSPRERHSGMNPLTQSLQVGRPPSNLSLKIALSQYYPHPDFISP